MIQSKPDEISELMNIEQLAARLGITVRHVRRLVAERRLPYYKVGRLVRFSATEIEEWLQSHRFTAAHPHARLLRGTQGCRCGPM